LLLDSGLYQKVDALRRNQWSASARIGGRLAPELVVGFPRIMQMWEYLLNENFFAPHTQQEI
jgi:hypothetical protein